MVVEKLNFSGGTFYLSHPVQYIDTYTDIIRQTDRQRCRERERHTLSCVDGEQVATVSKQRA